MFELPCPKSPLCCQALPADRLMFGYNLASCSVAETGSHRTETIKYAPIFIKLYKMLVSFGQLVVKMNGQLQGAVKWVFAFETRIHNFK